MLKKTDLAGYYNRDLVVTGDYNTDLVVTDDYNTDLVVAGDLAIVGTEGVAGSG